MKMLLVADGQLDVGRHRRRGAGADRRRGRAAEAACIQTLAELQDKLLAQGFLLLNASLVFRKHVAPVDGRARLAAVPARRVRGAGGAQTRDEADPGAVGQDRRATEQSAGSSSASRTSAPSIPYNLSFIGHDGMQALFGPMQLAADAL